MVVRLRPWRKKVRDYKEEDNYGDYKEEDFLKQIHEEVGDGILNKRDHTDFDKFLSGQVNNKEEHNKLVVNDFDDFVTHSSDTGMGNEYTYEE